MITIENLEVNLDVAADEDEAHFAQLFERYFAQFMQAAEEERVRQKEDEEDRRLDRRGGAPW